MAKRRVLDEGTGKFRDYTGPKPEGAKVKSPETKIAEREELNTKAASAGFVAENPVLGGLTDADKELIKKGMSLIDLTTLASVRKVNIPKDLEDKKSIVKFLLGADAATDPTKGLSEADKETVRAGISIPEMRKLAKDKKVVIPKEAKKALDIKAFLLAGEETEEEDDL